MEKPKIQEVIVVEGRYDKNVLRQIVDAPVFETHGFGVMNDRPLLGLLRRLAETRGLIILTDSDGAGFVIRNYLKGSIPAGRVLRGIILPPPSVISCAAPAPPSRTHRRRSWPAYPSRSRTSTSCT